MVIRDEHLVKINNKGRVQEIHLQLDFNIYGRVYSIYRTSSQFGGKEIDRPVVFITKGEKHRTVQEQAGYKFAFFLKDYLKNGYKQLSKLTHTPYSNLSEEDIKDILGGNFLADTKDIPRPMRAKNFEQCSYNVLETPHYCTYRIEAVRVLFYYRNGLVMTASQGGKDYNVATQHIRESEQLLTVFQKFPDLILDGYLYNPEWPLQKLIGVCRSRSHTKECNQLEFWIYDYVSKDPFSYRVKILQEFAKFFEDNTCIKVVPHILLSGILKILDTHNSYVKQGFDGLEARNPDKPYGIGLKSVNYLIEVKQFQTNTFRILNITSGSTYNDINFVMQSRGGYPFIAKPHSMMTIKDRHYYLDHKEEIIGKFAFCKYPSVDEHNLPEKAVLQYIVD